MFLSVCNEMIWQEAKCDPFRVKVNPNERNTLCTAIQQAQASGKILHIVVDQQGLFDITDKMPAVMSSVDKLSVETLAQLLDRKVFTRITARDYLLGTAKEKFSSREKALLALSLARCLVDFFDQDLGSHSWKPESLYFLRRSGTHASDRALYISLKPPGPGTEVSASFGGVGPGNPVLLAFAKLLLEIDSGDTIPIEIQPESKGNLSKWAEMCDFVSVAEREGSGNYLKAVEGCLYLHMALPNFLDEEGAPATDQILRKAIYEQVVRNLELMAKPETAKRKRHDLISDLPISKKLSLAPSVDQRPSVVLPAQKPVRPSTRDEFEVAIVCALPLEFNAVSALIDELWDEDGDYYGKADGDTNMYTTGRIEKTNIVLVLLSGMGKVNAATAAANLRSSYSGLQLALVTGICGGVPYIGESEELLLCDVIISKRIIQYDFGKQYPDEFATTTTVEDSLGRASKHIRSLLAVFETDLGRDRLERKTAIYLQQIQERTSGNHRRARYKYPGASHDRLFQAHYQHKHHGSPQCSCADTHNHPRRVCKESRTLPCDHLGCDSRYLVHRERLELKRQLEAAGRSKEAQAPAIHIGSIGSGDAVIKSGEDRDKLAERHGLAAFEMEGAGVWEEVPCIVVKAVCDYADSHKNKTWQHFAAATAASTVKALLERYTQTGKQPHGRFER
ncbi:nucleoside phosphorylase domain-containing protein [Aspergillus californicus]